MIEIKVFDNGEEIKSITGKAALWCVLDDKYIGGVAGKATYGELGLMACGIGKFVYEDAPNAEAEE